jgi:hypothetical protein
MMDWTYPETNDEAGIFEIGRRLAERLRGMALDKLTAQLGAPVLVAL